MSKLAHPGASSTVSPGLAILTARATASSIESATAARPAPAACNQGLGRRADRDHESDVRGAGERGDVEALVETSGDKHDRFERIDGGEGGMGVGRLGVVDEGETGRFRDRPPSGGSPAGNDGSRPPRLPAGLPDRWRPPPRQ